MEKSTIEIMNLQMYEFCILNLVTGEKNTQKNRKKN